MPANAHSSYVHPCAYIYARGFELCSSSGEKDGERRKERNRRSSGRDGEIEEGERRRKHGGGQGTKPRFDPRKRRRQSRRVLGSIPQGGRHSAALKPSVLRTSSLSPIPPAPSLPPVRATLVAPLTAFPTANLRPTFLIPRSPLRLSVSPPLASFALQPIYLVPLSPFHPPSVAILALSFTRVAQAFSLRGSLPTLTERKPTPEARSAKLRPPDERRGWLEDFFVTTGRCCAS